MLDSRLCLSLAALLITATPVQGMLSYHVDDFCFPRTCNGVSLNNRGAVVGVTSDGGFLYDPESGFVFLNPSMTPYSINDNGIAVGTTFPAIRAFAYVSPTRQTLFLPGAQAFYINNHGDIAGDSGGPPPQLIPGYELQSLTAITDDGTIIGIVNDVAHPRTVVYSPGSSPILLDDCTCRTQAGYFNNQGQVVINGSLGKISLYTPATGVRILPLSTEFKAAGLSDSGLLYLTALTSDGGRGHYIYDTTGSLGPGNQPLLLESLLPLNSGWTLGFGASSASNYLINRRGEVLVNAMSSSGRVTYVKLVPDTPLAPHTSPMQPNALQSLALPDQSPISCEAGSFNSAPLCGN